MSAAPVSLTRYLIGEQRAGRIGADLRLPEGVARTRRSQPTGLHMRVPVFLGSKAEVDAAVRYHREHDARADGQAA